MARLIRPCMHACPLQITRCDLAHHDQPRLRSVLREQVLPSFAHTKHNYFAQSRDDLLCSSYTMLTFSRAFRPSIFRGVKLFSSVKVHTNRLFVPRCVAGYSNGPGAKGSNGESFQDNEAEGYSLQQSNTEAKLEQLLDSPTRYQPIEKREDRSDIPPSVVETICLGKYMTTYRDALFFREPKELAVFRQFFACTRPRTVIELGTFTGSSAVWFADTAALYGLSLFHGTARHGIFRNILAHYFPERNNCL